MSLRWLRKAIYRVMDRWARIRFAFKRRTGLLGRPGLIAYRGYEGPDGVWLKGRALEDRHLDMGGAHGSLLRNLWQAYKRYETDEIRNARVAWRCGEASGSSRADVDGYFTVSLPVGAAPAEAPWVPVELTLTEAPGYKPRAVTTTGLVRRTSPQARFLVISDIDDTIVETNAFALLKHWRTVLAHSPAGRTAFPGVTPLYQALARGAAGPQTNPVFYVSSSPWNLYDFFERYLQIHAIPPGPLFLKQFGLDETKWFTGGHEHHKSAMIEAILSAHPGLPAILIGDSGQRDAAIYADVAERHPVRVHSVHIRDVRKGLHDPGVDRALDRLRERGVGVTLSPDLRAAAEYEAEAGFIDAQGLTAVREAVAERRAEGSA